MITTYIIPDPQHEYALSLIETIKTNYKLRPICVYSDSKVEVYNRRHFPELAPEHIVAKYYLDKQSIAEIAADIKSKYKVLNIVPYFEQSIGPMTELMSAMGLTWNRPEVLARFRNKSALKDHIRREHPSVDIGISRAVNSVADVFSSPLPERYVIKPNDGFANRDIGFFDRSASESAVAAYFDGHGRMSCILEEFFEGREFAINGQMDHAGHAMIINITEYERVPGNGKQNLYHRTHHVRQTAADYAPLAAYTTAVMEASGLLRCPFHMEVMLTAAGPRLIEVGARFGGTRYAYMTNDVHGGAFNYFALAAHYYLYDHAHAHAPLDWEYYNRISYVHLDGITSYDGLIYNIEGVSDVENMAEFKYWVVKPVIGGRVFRTLDLYSVPYSFHMMSLGSREELVQATERAKKALRINERLPLLRRTLVNGTNKARGLEARVRWLWHRLQSARGAC